MFSSNKISVCYLFVHDELELVFKSKRQLKALLRGHPESCPECVSWHLNLIPSQRETSYEQSSSLTRTEIQSI